MTGACGQVGQELLPALRAAYGADNVIASDVRKPPPGADDGGRFLYLDVTQAAELSRIVTEHRVGTIVHLAALLSATGEKNPQLQLLKKLEDESNSKGNKRSKKKRAEKPSAKAPAEQGPAPPKKNSTLAVLQA